MRTKLPSKHQINMGGFWNFNIKWRTEIHTWNTFIYVRHFSFFTFKFDFLALYTLVYLRFWTSTAIVKINTTLFWPLKMSKIRFMTFKTRFNWIYNWNDKTNIFYKAVYWFQNWKSQKIALWHFELSVVISKKTNWRHLVCLTELLYNNSV